MAALAPSASRYDEMYTELKDSLDIPQDGEIPLMEKELVFSIAPSSPTRRTLKKWRTPQLTSVGS